MTDPTNGEIKINVLVSPGNDPPRCNYCHGRRTIGIVMCIGAARKRLDYPCPRCCPEWWRDSPDAPGKVCL